MKMAFLTKLYLLALVLLLLSDHSGWCISASSLHHQGDEKQNWRWFPNCRNGNRKLSHLNCENANEFTKTRKLTPWSQSLKTALSPPPAPIMRGGSPSEDNAPPPPNK